MRKMWYAAVSALVLMQLKRHLVKLKTRNYKPHLPKQMFTVNILHTHINIQHKVNTCMWNTYPIMCYVKKYKSVLRLGFRCEGTAKGMTVRLCVKAQYDRSSLLRGRESDGFPQYQEKFIRDCIRKFPYCETTLLQQLVRSIAPVEIVSHGKHQRSAVYLFISCERLCVCVRTMRTFCVWQWLVVASATFCFTLLYLPLLIKS